MKEIFKDITGYEGYYQVSDHGKIRSLDRQVLHNKYEVQKHKGRLRKQNINRLGYLMILLSRNPKRELKSVHRLVALAFVERVEGKDEINHKDGNKLNNHYLNLEWCTHKENMQHASLLGLMATGQHHGKSKPTKSDVLQIRRMIDRNWKLKDIAPVFNVTPENIYAIKNGISWNHI